MKNVPKYAVTNNLDTLSDLLFGTNHKQIKNLYNQNLFNQQQLVNQLGASLYGSKYINENKYVQNMNGMLKAGINPLIASGSLGSNQTMSTNGSFTNSTGSNKNSVSDLLGTIIKLAMLFV